MASKLLCYGIGNISRGDDALGPLLLNTIEPDNSPFAITKEDVFQLQPENLFELNHHDLVLFLDADARFSHGISFQPIKPSTTESPFVSHALSPQRLLSMHQELSEHATPSAFLLSMGSANVELNEGLSEPGQSNLDAAVVLLNTLLTEPVTSWEIYYRTPI